MGRSTGIVVPAYKPGRDTLVGYLEALGGAFPEAILRVELDGPAQDDLLDAIEATGAQVRAHDGRRGKGQAIGDGFDALDTDVLAFVDADASTPIDSLAAVLEALEAGADLATGSRRHPEADVPTHQGRLRRSLGSVFARMARILLSVELHDYQCGAKAMTAQVWDSVRGHVRETGFAWDVEVLAIADALGYRVVEVPIRWEDQPGSTVPPVRTSWELLRALLRARSTAARLKR